MSDMTGSDTPPIAVGINCAHDASVAVCSPAGILCAIQEERITRLKHHYGFPVRALETALASCSLSARDVGFVAFSTQTVLFPEQPALAVILADGRLLSRQEARARGGWLRSMLRHGLDALGLSSLENVLRAARVRLLDRQMWAGFADRHYSHYSRYLSDLGLISGRVMHYYIAHHRAHAASAFRLSGMDDACVVTLDGKGDGLSGAIYRGYGDGRLVLLRRSLSSDSLGALYQAATEALGFVPVDGEYKTMGLAALGAPNGRPNPFVGCVRVRDGVLASSMAWKYRSFNAHNPDRRVPNPIASVSQTEQFKRLLDTMEPEQFAYFAQDALEGAMLNYARDSMRLTASTAIAAAGGVMLNVKGNSLIRDKLRPSAYFVFPDSADSGLAAGAALEALHQSGHLTHPKELGSPYLGHSFDEATIERELWRYRERHSLLVTSADPEHIAEQLVRGCVIGTFQGRLEIGPRALGNRSVLADPRALETKNRINLILKGREWFVPFAPVLLDSDAHLYWDGSTDYRYMTFAVQASRYARDTVPAVVHVDGTMRPQVVSPHVNRWLHEVLSSFKRRTGVGVLINTSFNRHGLPIVGAPADALDHLVNGWVDGLAIGRWYVERGPA
jgi:carbamoyltransferase